MSSSEAEKARETAAEFVGRLGDEQEARLSERVAAMERRFRRDRLKDGLIAAVIMLIIGGVLYNASTNREQDLRDSIAEDRSADISAALSEQEAAQQTQAQQLEDFLAAQQAAGVPLTAADLQSAIAGVSTDDPALKAALEALAEQLAMVEAQVKQPGPAGPSGPTGSAGPPGEDGAPYSGPSPSDGEDGQDCDPCSPPSISFQLTAAGELVVTIDGDSVNLGVVTGAQGPQGAGQVDMQCDQATGRWVATYLDPATGATSTRDAGSCVPPTVTETVTVTQPTSDPPPTTDPPQPTDAPPT